MQEKYEHVEALYFSQRHEIEVLQKKLEELAKEIKTLREEIDQKATHCERCGQEFHELNEESYNGKG